MKAPLIHSKRVAGDLLRLNGQELNRYLNSVAVPVFLPHDAEEVGYVPGLDLYFQLDQINEEEKQSLALNVDCDNFTIAPHGSLLALSTVDGMSPTSSVLFSPFCRAQVEEYLDVTEQIALLVQVDPKSPIYIGHELFITRLQNDFPQESYIVPIARFMNTEGVTE